MTDPVASPAEAIYRRFGVEPVVNCGGYRSFYGNSAPPEAVRRAMSDAAGGFVLMTELAEAAGRRLAELTGAEWGLVTAGSAAALTLATAACVAGRDPDRMLRLPHGAGDAVVLMPAGHRFAYDQAIRLTGCRIVEFADRDALVAALDRHRVVMVALFGERETPALALERILAETRPRGIPVLVDAASEFLEAPERWTARGADLVVYSVGKAMRGPSATGLLLGRAALVRAAWINGPPHQSFGRPLKIAKEQIVGALVAVETWLARDAAAERAEWLARLDTVAAALDGLDGVTTERDDRPGIVPRLRIHWSVERTGFDFTALRDRLLAGGPRILLDDYGGAADATLVSPLGLDGDSAALVGRALRSAFAAAPVAAVAPAAPIGGLSGSWRVVIDFADAPVEHHFELVQIDGRLTGLHRLGDGVAALEGHEAGGAVVLELTHRVEDNYVRHTFEARLGADGRLVGRVTTGAAASHTRGPTTFGQFGSVAWQGERVAPATPIPTSPAPAIHRINPDGLRHRADATIAAGLVFVSGVMPSDPTLDLAEQVRDALAQIDARLAAAGSDRSRLLAATIWLTDLADVAVFNTVWNAWIVPGDEPARACVQAGLQGGGRLEIAVTAAA
ncbi:hypothetical protein EYW49_00770 [Siculibacillus lacustris]|uniref:Aminotransferase class V-fold PLP-dependent enzyme n=1 Tax=Siculibacillus lacustris TaxID=1549641 RepID=A0A4Q9VY26_9HYPH|nr:Rid family hydrolase [Siculibacillus lacustris]TBW41290.1 hypothetical protein EYW49_00770 [Siculibacillus lacustris]